MTTIWIDMPMGWGQSRIVLHGEHKPRDANTTCSVDHRGARLIWSPEGLHAASCDLEHVERDCEELAPILGASSSNDLLRRWVVSESLAKVANVPILLWIRNQGLASISATSPYQETIPTSNGDRVAEILTLNREFHIMAFVRVVADGS